MRFKAFVMLIVLLLSVICSVSIVSATLSVKNIASSSGIAYRAANDTVGVNVSSTSNVSMNGVLCIKQGATTYICAVNDVVSTPKVIYRITNDEGDSDTASIYVDNNIGSISYTLKSGQNSTSLDYTVQDLGFNNNNLCSGISSLIVYDGSTVLNTVDINGTPGTCMYSGSINLSISDSGTKSISVEAIDNVGNTKSSVPQNITLDLSAPEVINGLSVKYAGRDKELDVIGGSSALLVDIYFNIKEENLAGITLDLSGANTNPVVQYAYKNVDLPLSNCVINDTTNGRIYQCYIKNVPLSLSSTTSTLSISVTARDTYNNVGSANLSKSFTVDTVVPKVSITTDHCDSIGKCYIQNGLNRIILTMDKENFNNQYVFFNLPGSTFGVNKVTNCTGSVCTALVSLTCDSGSTVDVAIAGFSGVQSQDDAGNIVAPYETYLYCDNNAPVIKNITAVGSDTSIITDLVSGSTLIVNAMVTEVESTELNASLWTDKATNSTVVGTKDTCVKINNYDFNCTWIISNINAGYYVANILVNITDTVGNNVVKPYNFKVFGFKSDNETPDNIGIRFRQVYPDEINRVVVDMATSNRLPYYVYAQYDLFAIKEHAGSKVSILHQQVDVSNCVYIGTLGTTSASAIFSQVTVSNPYGALTDIGRIDFKFNDNTDPNLLDNEFLISCNISVIVKEGNNIYKNPEQLQLDIPFKMTNTKLCALGTDCTPGVVLGDKIKKEEDNLLVRAEILGLVDNLMPKLQKVCSLRDTVSQSSNAALITSVITSGLSLSSGNVKVGNIPFSLVLRLTNLDACLAGPSAGYGNYGGYANGYSGYPGYANSVPGSQFNGVAANLPLNGKPDLTNMAYSAAQLDLLNNRANIAKACSGFVGKACDFLTCTTTVETDTAGKTTVNKITDGYQSESDIKQASKIPDLFKGEGVFGNSFMSESERMISKNVNVPDVSNSMFMAIKTGCWPAVIYNTNKWRQTECAYLYCMKVASYTGTDISTCDKAKFAQTCSLVVGEALQDFDITRKITSYMDNLKDYVSNFLPLASASLLKKVMCPQDIPKGTLDAFEAGKLPKTTTEQQFRLYACQLPLQIARFADSKSRSKQKLSFVYPEDQDMCALAKCVGEPNCKYEPGFWETLNQIDLPTPSADNKNKAIDTLGSQNWADSNQLKIDLRDLRSEESMISTRTTQINTKYGSLEKAPSVEVQTLDAMKAQRDHDQQLLIDKKVLSPDYTITGDAELQLVKSKPEIYLSSSTEQNTLNDLNAKMKALDTKYNYDEKLNAEYGYDEQFSTADAQSYANLLKQKDALFTNAVDNRRKIDVDTTSKNIQDCLAKSNGNLNSVDCYKVSGVSAIDQQAIDTQKKDDLGMDLSKNNPDAVAKFKALTYDEQVRIAGEQQDGFNRLSKYDQILSNSYGGYKDTDMFTIQGVLGVTSMSYGAIKADRERILKQQNLCDGAAIPCSNDNTFVGTKDQVKANLKAYQDALAVKAKPVQDTAKNLQQFERAYKTSEAIGTGIFMGLQYLNSQHMIDWFFTDGFIEKITGGKNLGQFLDFRRYPQSWCNPDSPINLDAQSDSGSVVSCGSGICQPVLTYAAERTELESPNHTKYNIYTTTYFISGGDLRGKDISYNIYFIGDGPELKGYRDDSKLNAFEIVQKKSAFISKNTYTQMCVEFNHPFPPDNALENAVKYCRPIISSADGGAFNTGSPWTPQEESTIGNSASGVGLSTNEYDSNGNRIPAPGTLITKDTRSLGVYE